MSLAPYRPGEELTAARLNQIVAAALQNIVGGDGIQVTRAGNGIRIGLATHDRGIPPSAVNPAGAIGTDNYGTFIPIDSVSAGAFTSDGDPHDKDSGYASAKAILAYVSTATTGAYFRRKGASGVGTYVGADMNEEIVIPADQGVFTYEQASPGSVMGHYLGYWT